MVDIPLMPQANYILDLQRRYPDKGVIEKFLFFSKTPFEFASAFVAYTQFYLKPPRMTLELCKNKIAREGAVKALGVLSDLENWRKGGFKVEISFIETLSRDLKEHLAVQNQVVTKTVSLGGQTAMGMPLSDKARREAAATRVSTGESKIRFERKKPTYKPFSKN